MPTYLDESERIYHYQEKIEKERQTTQEHRGITERNKQLIFEFIRYRQVQKHNSAGMFDCKLQEKAKH